MVDAWVEDVRRVKSDVSALVARHRGTKGLDKVGVEVEKVPYESGTGCPIPVRTRHLQFLLQTSLSYPYHHPPLDEKDDRVGQSTC